jgi:uncharacterized protein with von Willebrand factor type A (vWA) domain
MKKPKENQLSEEFEEFAENFNFNYIFLVDRSGSMQGSKMEVTIKALLLFM